MEKELKQPQQEMNELQKLSDTNQLKEKLVDKDYQLSEARKKRQRRNMAHTAAMNQLSLTEAALEESRQKLDGLQLNLQKKVEEQDTILQSQLEQTKGGVKGQLGEEVRRRQRELWEGEKSMQRQQESFKKKLRELSELWQAKTAEKQRELEEKIQQRMENTKDEEPKQNQLNNKRERQKIRKSSSGLCGNGRSGDGQ